MGVCLGGDGERQGQSQRVRERLREKAPQRKSFSRAPRPQAPVSSYSPPVSGLSFINRSDRSLLPMSIVRACRPQRPLGGQYSPPQMSPCLSWSCLALQGVLSYISKYTCTYIGYRSLACFFVSSLLAGHQGTSSFPLDLLCLAIRQPPGSV